MLGEHDTANAYVPNPLVYEGTIKTLSWLGQGGTYLDLLPFSGYLFSEVDFGQAGSETVTHQNTLALGQQGQYCELDCAGATGDIASVNLQGISCNGAFSLNIDYLVLALHPLCGTTLACAELRRSIGRTSISVLVQPRHLRITGKPAAAES